MSQIKVGRVIKSRADCIRDFCVWGFGTHGTFGSQYQYWLLA